MDVLWSLRPPRRTRQNLYLKDKNQVCLQQCWDNSRFGNLRAVAGGKDKSQLSQLWGFLLPETLIWFFVCFVFLRKQWLREIPDAERVSD